MTADDDNDDVVFTICDAIMSENVNNKFDDTVYRMLPLLGSQDGFKI